MILFPVCQYFCYPRGAIVTPQKDQRINPESYLIHQWSRDEACKIKGRWIFKYVRHSAKDLGSYHYPPSAYVFHTVVHPRNVTQAR